jgi:NADPH:quinone reductase-like Zn-dependent oxidoreductase
MKAALIYKFGSTSVFSISEIPVPEPADNEVLVKVFAASVNPVDIKHRKGNHKYLLGSPFPIVLGYDFAGQIVKTGNAVTSLKPGNWVNGRSNKKYGGTYAEYAITSSSSCAALAKSADIHEASALPLAGVTALQALRDKGRIKPGMNVLVNGASGGVGHFAIQLAKLFGCTVTAVSSARHTELMRRLQPDKFIDYKQQDFTTQNNRYDIILDAVGTTNFLQCRSVLKKGGVYITVLPRPKLILHKFISLFTQGKKARTLLMKANLDDIQAINNWYQSGNLFVHIEKTFTLDDTDKAHAHIEHGHTEGKIIIKVSHQ